MYIFGLKLDWVYVVLWLLLDKLITRLLYVDRFMFMWLFVK